jgi:hypothetical protein
MDVVVFMAQICPVLVISADISIFETFEVG